MDAKKAVEAGDMSQLFQFALDLQKESARHVPLARVSFGRENTAQSEKEFLLWHAACCLNELAKRAEEFSLTLPEVEALRGAVAYLQRFA